LVFLKIRILFHKGLDRDEVICPSGIGGRAASDAPTPATTLTRFANPSLPLLADSDPGFFPDTERDRLQSR
jgi:hypothetical protein